MVLHLRHLWQMNDPLRKNPKQLFPAPQHLFNRR